MKDWEIIADNLSKAGWTWGCIERVDSNGKTIFVADAQNGGKRFAVRADDKLTAFTELDRQIRAEFGSILPAIPSGIASATPDIPKTHSRARQKRPVLITIVAVLIIVAFGAVVWNFGDSSSTSQSGDDSANAKATDSRISTTADFKKYALKLKEKATAEVESQVIAPTNSRSAVQHYPWKTNIVTTVFWIGEKQHQRSVWNPNWLQDYGGLDNPDRSQRRSYIPIPFVPRQNPFYCALPYSDLNNDQNDPNFGLFKAEASRVIPWFKQAYTEQGQSVCWHRWIAIRKGNRTCYGQWEDVGPFRADHFQYVFGNERPMPNANHGAGLDVSPAVRDYLGLQPTDVTDWQFVDVKDVPPGPWRSYGENNNFVLARRQMEQRLVQPNR